MRCVTGIIAFFACSGFVSAESTGFFNRTYEDANGTKVKYTVFVPHDYKKGTHPPAMLFLHGSGETGTDGQRQAQVGIGKAVRIRENRFPFVVVFPQAQKREPNLVETWYPAKTEGRRAIAILDVVVKEYDCDPKRVYLTGISMGGFGTWALAEAHPKKWAAIAPICGGGSADWVGAIKDIPCWAFHGEKDAIVPAFRSRQMIDALKKVGAQPKYDEYPGVDHNSWDKAYANDALYDWFLSHKQK